MKAGKALHVGISSYSAERTREAAGILRSLGTPLLIHQPSYSMLNRWIEDGLLDVLGEEGVGCITFSPLAQGLLTDRYLEGIPDDSRVATGGAMTRDMLTEENLAKFRALNDIAKRRGQTLAEMALAIGGQRGAEARPCEPQAPRSCGSGQSGTQESGDVRTGRRPQTLSPAVSLVAGEGFEPATSGL